jgi:hypothetical protein
MTLIRERSELKYQSEKCIAKILERSLRSGDAGRHVFNDTIANNIAVGEDHIDKQTETCRRDCQHQRIYRKSSAKLQYKDRK